MPSITINNIFVIEWQICKLKLYSYHNETLGDYPIKESQSAKFLYINQKILYI
jgi:hypothetical protein